ncbi:MAG: radical SAM protein [Candidatus Aenigmarchaeota archaeon]|nr:radical SAM protein [Candidatus Aenigmarchaeota archaeon]
MLLHYNCNNNCRFCYCANKKGMGYLTTEEAKRELEKGLERGCTFVDFNGGEPTIRKDLVELIRYAKSIGYETVAITSNGRMLSYKSYAKKLIDAGLNHAILSIHGHNAEVHDFLTRVKGSFDQVTKGLKNLKEMNPNIYICTNTTITKYNYMYLPQIAENNIKLGTDACEFIFVHPRGNALINFEEVVPTLTEVKPFIPKTIEIGKKYGIKHFDFRYFPLCYVPPQSLSELKALNHLREQHVGPEFQDLNVEDGRKYIGRVKGPQCKKCKYYDICEGIFKEYAERRGFDELTPVLE